MAKKSLPVNPNADKVSDTKPSAGWKECKSCHKWIKGLTTKNCYNCQAPFTFADKGSKKTTSPAVSPVADFSVALSTLDKVKNWAKRDYDKALQSINELETLAKNCGGISGLKGAIETLRNWTKPEEKPAK